MHGVAVPRMDKTWIVQYDDLGRPLRVMYPDNASGGAAIKLLQYDDLANAVTTTSPEGRVVVQRLDWSGNLILVD